MKVKEIVQKIKRKIEPPEKKKEREEKKKREEREKLSENPGYLFINSSMLNNTRLSLEKLSVIKLRKKVDEDFEIFFKTVEAKLEKDRTSGTSNTKRETKELFDFLKNMSEEEINAIFNSALRLNFSESQGARYRIDPTGTRVFYNSSEDPADYTEKRMEEIKEKQKKEAFGTEEKIRDVLRANPRELFSKEDLQLEMGIFENWFSAALQKAVEIYEEEGIQKILIGGKYYFCYNDLLPKTEEHLKKYPNSFFLPPNLFKILYVKTREDKFFFKEAVKELVSNRNAEGFLLKTYNDDFEKWEFGYSNLGHRITALLGGNSKTEAQIKQALKIAPGSLDDDYLEIILDYLVNKGIVTKTQGGKGGVKYTKIR